MRRHAGGRREGTRAAVVAFASVVALAAVACGGKPQASTPAPDSAAAPAPAAAAPITPAAATARDTTKKAAADSTTPASAAMKSPAKEEKGDYDRILRPKFKVDEKTGKVTPIKRP